jgi:GT2 family glycosyltransferase
MELLVSAIIANWNGASELETCLASLRSQSYEPLEILVIDNGSVDDSEKVARAFEVQWKPLGHNFGLAHALNHGAAVAAGELLLFLNNDMSFHPDFTRMLVDELLNDDRTFAADAVQWDAAGHHLIHMETRLAMGRRQSRPGVQIVPGLHIRGIDPGGSGEPVPTLTASAANMMVRRRMFETLGGFDSRFFLGYEDLDLCWRARLKGWEVVSVPMAICWHELGVASTRSEEGKRIRFKGTVAGRMVFATKLLPAQYLALVLARSFAALAFDIVTLRWGSRGVRDRLAVLLDVIRRVPDLLRDRRRLYGEAGASPREHLTGLLNVGSEAASIRGRTRERNG